MYKISNLLLFSALLTFCILTISCSKERNIKAIIVEDCTGTYLRINSKDYKVCNLEMIENFTSGQKVEVSFEKIDDCKGSGNFPVTCYLYHPFEAWAFLTKIN